MNSDEVYLRHILDCVEKIERFTFDGKEAFFLDDRTQDAVIRNLEIIGEAVKNLSSGLKAAHDHIEWSKITGMRDKLIHHYFGVKLDLVWDTIATVVPGFKIEVARILTELQGSP